MVVWPNGRPAANADVHLESEEHPGWCVNGCGNANRLGQFVLHGYAGTKYRIQAEAPINPKADYDKHISVYAEPVWFQLKENVTNVRIVLTLDEKTYKERFEKKKEEK